MRNAKCAMRNEGVILSILTLLSNTNAQSEAVGHFPGVKFPVNISTRSVWTFYSQIRNKVLKADYVQVIQRSRGRWGEVKSGLKGRKSKEGLI
jgi:hypothetical protein